MSFAHLEEQGTPVFRDCLYSDVLNASRLALNQSLSCFEDARDHVRFSNTLRYVQMDPLLTASVQSNNYNLEETNIAGYELLPEALQLISDLNQASELLFTVS